ncbi:amino acid transporter, putative [Talaromyces stipitatus ATCC 10500]|uniref:Amino acid transporter, putative n=1 Tax=Talaromyces stipitatus (strain ATCC 10500 / CBS 375.48 / QM 6759 / NRRL 1006) TaxID=441959 RepID=B8MEM2_TALSN|nr:amino acid transporter, putative [Talaromyces stipitatus ATCC 10500]EED16905.1 amino acid transporter, putative [Talaromyces stipitatus ATCC 10500]
MAQPASVLGDRGDPRLHEKERDIADAFEARAVRGGVHPQHRPLHDSSVTFEEYNYYAQLSRAEEDTYTDHDRERGWISLIFPSKSDAGEAVKDAAAVNTSDKNVTAGITDDEWTNASRALRTATRGAIFYLITTDILGPFGLPYAFGTMGWGPGIALYTVFAGLAIYSGYLLWDVFMGLDSFHYPIRHFGDLGFRLYGPWMRYLINVLQSIQLILNVGLIVISNGEALSQVAKFKLCFIVCCLIWAIVGFLVGQIRTLQKFGWIANAAVWLNLICMFISMGGAANGPPNYASVSSSAGQIINGGISVQKLPDNSFPPVQTSGGLPHSDSFAGTISGAMNAVFAYGGAMVFPEFMAEMRRPKDFLTGMWAAQAFIYFWYMFYGLFMYGYQGQYVVNPSYLGVSGYAVQTAGNVFAFLSAAIAAALYGNIGVKVLYNSIFVELFRFPPLTTKGGKIAWVVLIPIYWSVAFILAASIPNFSGLTSVVASFCILHFTYSFPPLFAIAFWAKKFGMQEGEGFQPESGEVVRRDSGFRRFIRGFFFPGFATSKYFYMNVFNIIYLLGALALAGLGSYSSIETLKDAFASSVTTSFTCKSPVDN